MLRTLLFGTLLLLLPFASHAKLLAGASRVKITGSTLGPALMGYANPSQLAEGLHMDLFARAIVVLDESSGERIALVNLDLSQVSPALKQAVVDRVAEATNHSYSHQNLLLSATHTHAAPGGLSHDHLYNVASLGFEPEYFDHVVDRTVAAIVRAEARLEPVVVDIVSDRLDGITRNRSLEAHDRNPPRERLPPGLDNTMQQIHFRRSDGSLLALWNAFSVHGTSLPNSQTLVSGDNKGWAAWSVEQRLPIVAAFANGAAGDVSPSPLGRGDSEEILEATRIVSESQADKAVQLADETGARAEGPVGSALHWVDMPSMPELCPPAIGYSMLAGAEDGPSPIPGLREGITRDDLRSLNPITRGAVAALKLLFGFAATGPTRCHEEKAVAFHLGSSRSPASPRTLPFQILRIGSIALAAIPFEATTASGRRIRAALEEYARPLGVDHVLLIGYANSYSGYLATPDEYELQHYEGASTHFGKQTLAGVTRSFEVLIERWRASGSVTIGRAPEPVPPPLWRNASRRSIDAPAAGSAFGSILRNPKKRYRPGEWAAAEFRAANPNNDLSEGRRWAVIERLESGRWTAVATEENPDTFVQWTRQAGSGPNGCGSCIRARISWRIPDQIEPGRYRMSYHAKARLSKQALEPITGTSRDFEIVPEHRRQADSITTPAGRSRRRTDDRRAEPHETAR